MASARRVWPRTMPTPVSSHEVSMPRTRGSSAMDLCSLYGGRVGQPHHQRVDIARLVVATPEADRLEAETGVEALGALVVHPHFEQHLMALERGGLAQQFPQEPGTETGAPLVPGRGDRLYVP